MYRSGLESILGFRLHGTELLLAPCVPNHWPKIEISFKYCASRYEIAVENPQAVSRGLLEAELDGVSLPCGSSITIPLINDGSTHQVRLLLGPPRDNGVT
jgi:cyclic beta-1,2-glucan synthetase